MTFFTDFKNMTVGGMNTFTRYLLVFIVIFALTVAISYFGGIYSSKGIVGVVMVLVAIFAFVGMFELEASRFPGNAKTAAWLAKYSVAFVIDIILGAAILLWRPMEEG